MKILFSWVGHADLLGFAGAHPEFRNRVEKLTGKTAFAASGPLRTVLDADRFDRIVLLWSYADTALLPEFRHSCDEAAVSVASPIGDPTDYRAVYCAARDAVERHRSADDEVYYLLSSGTPAMAAVWVLLGKTKFPGAFLQTFHDKVSLTEIPFDLTAELLPELLEKNDRLLNELPELSRIAGFGDIVGTSRAIREAAARAQKAAMHNVPVLITGESGTGKEMFARAMWKAGPRRNAPFEAINCAALPTNLLEAELFGYKKGAFTGAVKDRDGAFRRLDGGTLFLDEVGECSPELQAKLLRVLQPPPGKGLAYREFYPVGAESPEHSDVRIIAATNRDLGSMVEEQTFRGDLFFRLAAITLRLPPLRERREDIPLLAEALLARVNADFRSEDPAHVDKIFCENTKIFLKNQPWHGNVRELFNAVLQGVVMSSGREIAPADMGLADAQAAPAAPENAGDIPAGFSLDDALEAVERQYIAAALKQSGDRKVKAAELLGFSNYQRLDARMKKLGIGIK